MKVAPAACYNLAQVRFLYDDTIFAKSAAFDVDVLRSRIRELAFLNAGASIRLRAMRGGAPLVPALAQKPRRKPGSGADRTRGGAAAVREEESEEGGEPEQEEEGSPTWSGRGGDGASISGSGDGAAGLASARGGSGVEQPHASAPDADGWQLFHFDGGLREFVGWMNEGKMQLHEPIYFER